MPTAKKVIYSLRVYLELERQGYKPIATMPNPNKPKLMCWVFERTPEFTVALDKILEGEQCRRL